MPSRNVLKQDVSESFYHIYARGVGKQIIFVDNYDFQFFLFLFERYLTRMTQRNSAGYLYPFYGDHVQLLAYCQMPNHFHLLIYQHVAGSMSEFMKSMMVSYSRYFNKKYKRTGPLFESRYKASLINRSCYLEHISRYIHLNPRYWQRYRYSSLSYYLGKQLPPDWLKPSIIMELFNSPAEYYTFVADYKNHKLMLDQIKHELAG